jgi:hypothetical protein
MTAREWLRANGYSELATMIDEIMAEWKAAGNKQRRNWWQVLAGKKDGSPCVVAGRTFPVLKEAQKRQHMKVTRTAEKRSRRERAPAIRPTNRWPDSGAGA